MDDNKKHDEKTDWTLAESVLNSDSAQSPVSSEIARSLKTAQLVPTTDVGLPAVLNLSVPVEDTSRGILMKFRERKISRKAALRALEASYNSQLDALNHSLVKAVQIQKTRADVVADEYLRELDARAMAVMHELGLRNIETRAQTLLKLTDQTVARVKEVQEKDWPQPMIQETVNELFKLRKRFIAEMMKEAGGDYADE